MCAIFGIIDYKKVLSKVQREQMLKVLANECMSRGTDATGISYLKNDNLTIYKRPKKANKMRFKLPADSNIIMGHTRMTTQGNEKFNFNNHPFLGRTGKSKDRVELQKMLDFVRKGDTVIVESISRFARNTKDLLELIDILNSKQVVFISKKEAIDTTTPTGKFMLTIFGAVAELVREYIL